MKKGDRVIVMDGRERPDVAKAHIVRDVGEVFVKMVCGDRFYRAMLGMAGEGNEDCWRCERDEERWW